MTGLLAKLFGLENDLGKLERGTVMMGCVPSGSGGAGAGMILRASGVRCTDFGPVNDVAYFNVDPNHVMKFQNVCERMGWEVR